MGHFKQIDFNISLRKLVLIFLCAIFIVIASNRFWMGTSDTEAYLEFFEGIDDFWLAILRFEPTFSFLAYLIKTLIDSSYLFFFIIAFIGVGLKFAAIRLYAPYVYLSLLVYFSKYFLLQDMIQIRAGVASAIFLLSIKYIKNNNFLSYTRNICIASSFHFAALAYLFFYFICNKKLSLKSLLLIAISLIAGIMFLDVNHYLFQFASSYFQKIQIYVELKNQGLEAEINIFSIEFIINCWLFILFYFLRSKFIERYPCYDIWLRSMLLSLSISILFSDFPVFSLRLSELFGVTSIFLLPLVIDAFKEKFVGYIIYLLIVLAFIYNFYFRQGMIY